LKVDGDIDVGVVAAFLVAAFMDLTPSLRWLNTKLRII
jgi:hypothetical protein